MGWLIAPRESAELAQQLIADAVARHDVMPGALTLHADRGTSMRSKPVASLLVDLDVANSHSRPYTSDDNPYSESQFKTMKYRPDFPDRFGSIEDARSHCQAFFAWYNGQHRHSGIGHMTPHSVHYGTAQAIREVRQSDAQRSFRRHAQPIQGRPSKPANLAHCCLDQPPTSAKECHPNSTTLHSKFMKQGVARSLTRSAGGVRVCYYVRTQAGQVLMLVIYAKSAKDSIPGHILKSIKEVMEDAEDYRKSVAGA